MKSTAALIALLFSPVVLHAQKRDTTEGSEHALRAAQVPAAVRDAFRRAYPHAAVRGYSTEQENGRTIYEVQSREGGVGRDLSFAADGTILEIEETVPVARLPEAVRAAITTQAAGAAITRSERNVAGHDTTYEFAIRGRRGEVKLRGDGTPVPAAHRP